MATRKKATTKKAAAKKKPAEDKPADDDAVQGGRADPWASVKRAGEVADLARLKALIFGPTAAGKSRMAARFKRPIIGLTEHQAMPTIQEANPDALIKEIHTASDLVDFRTMVRDEARLDAMGVDAVVLDSVTDAQRIIRDYYTKKQGATAGRVKTTVETWGVVIDATARLVRELRDCRRHVLVIALDLEVEQDGYMVHRPSVNGKRLPGELAGYFNVVGYAHVKEHDDGTLRHEVMFRGDSWRYAVKPMSTFDAFEPPEPLWWAHKRFSGQTGEMLDERTRDAVDEWAALVGPEEKEEEED